MNNNTPFYPALSKKDIAFFVPKKLFAVELAASGIILFVLHLPLLLIAIGIIHLIVMILEKKEPSWQEILKFIISLPKDDEAII